MLAVCVGHGCIVIITKRTTKDLHYIFFRGKCVQLDEGWELELSNKSIEEEVRG